MPHGQLGTPEQSQSYSLVPVDGGMADATSGSGDVRVPEGCRKGVRMVVTGFGPFRDYKANPSWEAVRRLPALWQEQAWTKDHLLVVEQIPVSYRFVLDEVPRKWSSCHEGQETVIVHVGVSHMADCLTLETGASNSDYVKPDVDGLCPPDNVCVSGRCHEDRLRTAFDVDALVEAVNRLGLPDVKAKSSANAGRYLCEFVYFKSLHGCPGRRCLFVHVPETQVSPSERVAEGLGQVIKACLEQLPSSAKWSSS